MSLDAYPLISDWITVQDGRLIIHSGKVDIGQRISTALVQIAHEELSVPQSQIDMAPVSTGHAPDEGLTSGSNSIEQSGHALRCAGATLRVLLVDMAISRHGGSPKDWQLDNGDLFLPNTNHRIAIIDLIKDIPGDSLVNPNSPLRSVTAQNSRKPEMLGLSDMVQGRYTFIHDLDADNLQHARVVRPPHANARLENIPKQALQQLETAGLTLTQDGSFLAISGPQEWPVVKAAQNLSRACSWDQRDGLPEIDVFEELATKNAQSFAVRDGMPNDDPIPTPIDDPDLSARFERPYQMHASLAPSAAMALWKDNVLTIQCQSQGIYSLRDSIANSLDLTPAQVDITHVPGAGCYGHTGADDTAFEASLVAVSQPGVPILLKWTREEEHKWEPYAPAMAVNIAAKLKDGQIEAYSAEVFSDTHRGRPRAGQNRAGPARLLANHFRDPQIGPFEATPTMVHQAGMHRNLEPIYTFPQKRLVKNLVTGLAHRTSALRCLGGASNLFALESFMDDMAQSEGIDPISWRRTHMRDKRGLEVLETLEKQVSDTPKLSGRGIAYGQYKNEMTRVGICVDIEADDRAQILLKQATIVADAGRVIDPDGVIAQLEGGFIQAASWALYEQVEWDRDGILSTDWDSYPVIRFDNVPNIKVTLLDQPGEKSVGVGEASPGPTLAAIGNAIFDATGIRMHRLPFTSSAILNAAYKN